MIFSHWVGPTLLTDPEKLDNLHGLIYLKNVPQKYNPHGQE